MSPAESSPDPADDLQVTTPGVLVTVGGLALAAAGILQAAAGFQLVTMVITAHWWSDAWMWIVFLSALPLVPVGFGFTTARGWAIFPALPLVAFAGFMSFTWVVYTVINGGFTLATVAAAGFCFMAFVLAAVSLPRAVKVRKARKALLQGL